jgi:biopolymer transport protein ExbD
MRIYRRQKTLWRVGVISFIDLIVLSLAALVMAGGGATSTGPAAAYVITPAPDAGNQVVPVTITIEADSTLYLDGIPISLADLGERIADAVRISGGGHVTVEPEAGVPFEIVASALAVAGSSGARSLSLVSQPPAGGS